MDEEQTENIIPTDDVNIPIMTANLEMLTIDNNCSSSTETKRILRKRVPKFATAEVLNRRCTMKPKKRFFSEMDNSEEIIKKYYLNKNVKKKSNNLETIYEENDNINEDSLIYMSAKRFKRMLMFSDEPTTAKLKKRRARIQRAFGSRMKRNRCISMQTLENKLNAIKEGSSKTDNEFEGC